VGRFLSRNQAPDAVGVQLAIGAEDGNALDKRLRDDHAVERVAVNGWETASVSLPDRERSDVQLHGIADNSV